MKPRHIESLLIEMLQQFPVVLLTGARQVGKSTLASHVVWSDRPARYLTLDDRAVLDAATRSPDGLVAGLEGPVVLDEVQRAPDLLRAIKLLVDRDRRPGRFLLTGSANVPAMSRVGETLAGRVAVLELHPFSWSEALERPAPGFVDALFSAKGPKELVERWLAAAGGPSADAAAFVLSGGFPPLGTLGTDRARAAWFEGYRRTYVERDVRMLAGIDHVPALSRLLSVLLLRSSGLVNFAALSREVGLPATTVRRYVDLMVQTYQVFVVPPHTPSVSGRWVKSPRIYAADTGLVAHEAGVRRWDEVLVRGLAGMLVETFVAAELRKALTWAERPTSLSFWRTHGGLEVDFVLERGGAVAALEVKSGAGFSARDLAGLRALREALGARWRVGVILHAGDESLVVDDGIAALPWRRVFA